MIYIYVCKSITLAREAWNSPRCLAALPSRSIERAMDSGNRGPTPVLSPEAATRFGEGISLVLSRWTALQMAVQNGWGGRESRQKADKLASAVLSWFSNDKAPLYIDDLENILDENMVLSFNTEIEDGSIEEVAEQLMIMHEDCLQGNFESIDTLKNSASMRNAASQSRQVVNENEGGSSDEEVVEDGSEMMVDEPKPKETAVNEPKQPKQTPDEEGWFVVPTKCNRGKRWA
ncbi:putative pre-rRNA-processing protein TSR2 [Dioscorea sansibarensis]